MTFGCTIAMAVPFDCICDTIYEGKTMFLLVVLFMLNAMLIW